MPAWGQTETSSLRANVFCSAPNTGVDPIWLGIMMALNLQTSFMHPPLGASLFYLRSVAPAEVTTAQIYLGAVPFVIIELLCLVLLWFFPALATALPKALYG